MKKHKPHKLYDDYVIYTALQFYKNNLTVEFTKQKFINNDDIDRYNDITNHLYKLITKYTKKIKRHTR